MSVELYSTTWLSCHPALVFTPSRAATARARVGMGGGAPRREGGDPPRPKAAAERRLDGLPVPDARLFRVPADGLRLVVRPDALGKAELVGLAVAVGDDHVAGLEVG